MQSHGHANKYLPNVQNPWLIEQKTTGTQTWFQRTPTCSKLLKLLSKFLHLDENIHKNDAAVDQSTNMADDMCRIINDGMMSGHQREYWMDNHSLDGQSLIQIITWLSLLTLAAFAVSHHQVPCYGVLAIRGVQYVHCVMHKCIMVKVGGKYT